MARGAYKYQDCWWGGTFTYEGPYCGKWSETQDLSGTCCTCAGFYPCFDVRGLREHKKWEWRCK
ncbi:MAG: hypothetical protein JRJ16_07810 [Deltaproteobacteria bacterium]|nr:hypothetical protein [Deltaproteobacteria bacterium]